MGGGAIATTYQSGCWWVPFTDRRDMKAMKRGHAMDYMTFYFMQVSVCLNGCMCIMCMQNLQT